MFLLFYCSFNFSFKAAKRQGRRNLWANTFGMDRLAPYERRVIELLRNSKDKRARKLAKKRVCLHSIPFQHYILVYQSIHNSGQVS